ncbi:hypothetical protein [Clostridium cibarium]|uniref:Uncharacterized protein n=1 Tax=Clostridium cibarium TaxID=2762247 RepID=A0ABR8PTH5_9CLOT|nr:hypothetical protein [Clostridium cibarium]MBD7911410.1 hypothetical protein [Clostridium cibarium]
MSVYMITYFVSDTCGCGHDHDHKHDHEHIESSENNIIAKIKSVGAWANFMPEGYLVKSTLSAQEILEELKAVANKGDILFVTKTDADSCASTHQAVIEWISR